MPEMAEKFKHILEDLGEDPNRPGLVDTPKRAAQALLFFTKGYEDRYVLLPTFSRNAWEINFGCAFGHLDCKLCPLCLFSASNML